MTAAALGTAYPILPHSTLNERFKVLENANLNPNEIPTIGYYVIGCGAHDSVRGEHGLVKPDIYEHRAEDAALFRHLPFVLRQLNNDLTEQERQKYCLRVKENHDGIDYIAYYGKRLEVSLTEIRVLKEKVEDGVTTTESFIPDSSNLYPTRPELPPRGITVASNIKLRNNAELAIEFTEQDATELMAVARILFDDEEYAIISEIGLCSGVDRNTSVSTSAGTPITVKEVVACQVVTHVTTFHSVAENNMGFTMNFEIGSRTPLIAEKALDTTKYYTETGIVGGKS